MTQIWKEKASRKFMCSGMTRTALASWLDENDDSIIQISVGHYEDDGVGLFYWHIHHDKLIEKAIEPIVNRQVYIKQHKVRVTDRLRLLKQVKGSLPEGFEAMYDKYKEQDVIIFSPEVERLHAKECPNCPWNGKTILP